MSNDEKFSLPASVAAAWGLRDRPRRGPKRGLSLAEIVEAGVAVADAHGIDAVSMSRVARELGAAPMSLYRYVDAKDELLTLMVDAAYGPPPPNDVPTGGWRVGLSAWARAQFEVLRRHPWVVRVPIGGIPMTPNAVALLERGLQWLDGTPLTADEKMSTLLLLSGFIRNVATLAADIEAAEQAAGTTAEELLPDYGRLLARLAERERFPALHAVIDAGFFDEPHAHEAEFPDDEFTFGLERLLDGIESLMRSRTSRGSSGSGCSPAEPH